MMLLRDTERFEHLIDDDVVPPALDCVPVKIYADLVWYAYASAREISC